MFPGIRLVFSSMDITSCQSCSCDALKAYTVDGELLASFCGTSNHRMEAEFGFRALILVFTSRTAYYRGGFSLSYSFDSSIPQGSYPDDANMIIYIALGIAAPTGIILIILLVVVVIRGRKQPTSLGQTNSAGTSQPAALEIQLEPMPQRRSDQPPIVSTSVRNYSPPQASAPVLDDEPSSNDNPKKATYTAVNTSYL